MKVVMCPLPSGQEVPERRNRRYAFKDTPPIDFTTTSPLESALPVTVHPLPGGAYVQEEVGGPAGGAGSSGGRTPGTAVVGSIVCPRTGTEIT